MNAPTTHQCVAPTIKVRFETQETTRTLSFNRPFRIGRLEECEVCINHEYVGRVHADLVFESGRWWLRDLQSRNGIFVADERVERIVIAGPLTVRLGKFGPELSLEPEARLEEPIARAGNSITRYVKHYFGPDASSPAGERTIQVRRAFAQVQKVQRTKQRRIVAALLLAILAVGSYAFYENLQMRRQRLMARDLFYSIKSLDVEIANLERAAAGNPQVEAAIRRSVSRRRDLESSYDRFLASLHVYDSKMTDQQRIIMRVARVFGECELDMPAGFEAEINKYIETWRSSGRLSNALQTAKANGYAAKISQELLAQGLPPQFFYLALEESNFDAMASGPVTRFGIAKGMWQIMPNTAVAYGLRLGPLVELRQPDPHDERQQFDKSTPAAARYLKDLYSTDAQASGFLVMASYNWGENRVIPLIKSMPGNPRERNFWQLLALHRNQIPQETYDYVFLIVSAAVIGENPRLFGFDFDNPLAGLKAL
jgi:membrane-bound lytic murein transglycosylase D